MVPVNFVEGVVKVMVLTFFWQVPASDCVCCDEQQRHLSWSGQRDLG